MARNRILVVALVLVGFHAPLWADVNRYMVFFSDKDNSSYSISKPQDFLSEKAIERRINHKIPITINDIPVNRHYVDSLIDMGIKVFYQSKWMNGVLVESDQETIGTVESKGFVSRTEMVAPGPVGTARKGFIFKSLTINSQYQTLPTDAQNNMLGISNMHKDGFRGEGMTIAVFDGGFQNVNTLPFFQHLYENQSIRAKHNFISNNDSIYQYDDHGTGVLSCLAGYDPNQYIGAAYKADYILCVTEDVFSEYRIEEYNWLFAAEFADSAGTDVINSSLGYNSFDDASMNYTYEHVDGRTAVITKAASFAASKGILVVTSAGNEGNNGWRHIVPPADADSIIAVGAVNESLILSYFSSLGPTFDGRMKPELVAMGQNTKIISLNGNIRSGNGTSYAAPLIAGLAAGVWQAFPQLNNYDLIQLLKKSASHTLSPNNEFGYGVPSYETARVLKLQSMPPPRLIVYPNPLKENHFYIEQKLGYVALRPEIEMFNLAGELVSRLMIRKSTFENRYEVNIPNIPSGVYILAIAADNGVSKVKLVKN
jgi:serine protease AprX